jgi:PAS domain-containing protein
MMALSSHSQPHRDRSRPCDATTRDRLQATRASLFDSVHVLMALDLLPGLVAVLHREREFIRVNQRFEDVTGRTWRDASFESMIQTLFPHHAHEKLIQRLSGVDGGIDLRTAVAEGSAARIRWSVHMLDDGTVLIVGLEPADEAAALPMQIGRSGIAA